MSDISSLHQRYDGPIPETERDAAMSGALPETWQIRELIRMARELGRAEAEASLYGGMRRVAAARGESAAQDEMYLRLINARAAEVESYTQQIADVRASLAAEIRRLESWRSLALCPAAECAA